MIKMCIFLLRYPVEWWNLHAGHEHGQSVCNHGIRSGIVSAILWREKFYACNCSIAWSICLKSLFPASRGTLSRRTNTATIALASTPTTHRPTQYQWLESRNSSIQHFSERGFIFYQLLFFQHHLQPPWKSRLGLWTFVRSENCSNWKYAKRWTGESNCNISTFYAIDC